MSLAPGTQLGPYQVLAPLGKGGMGEVWRARDTKLGREVAIKTLPIEFAHDAERRVRFEQEARSLAALNHSNVGAIYGLEEREGAVFLVLELVEGATLADEIARGPLPVERAISIAAQIAEGLEAAHEAGIIHRDLKPANIKVAPVKILDFGLARTIASQPSGDMSKSPTMLTGTLQGVILGTVAYMSPEQARGEVVDKRSDIFAFGCVLYECLTGRQAFGGPTMTDALAATVKSDPDWSLLPVETPPSTRDLLRRCLQKNPRQRLQSIGDARVILQEAKTSDQFIETSTHLAPAAKRGWPTRVLVTGVIVGLAVGALVARYLPRQVPLPAKASSVRAVLPLRDGLSINPQVTPTIAISPDGTSVVFRGREGDAVGRLYRRPLDGGDPEPIEGTEGGVDPFFSPDGQWLAFFAQGRLKKVSLSGGAPVVICEVPPIAAGGTWTTDGWIIFSRGPNSPLSRVSPAGGSVEEFSRLDATRGEHAHIWPQALAGGRLLVTIVFGRDFQDLNDARAVIVSPGEQPRDIQEGSAFARIVAGWLVFVRGDAVLAAPFDERRLEVTGPPVRVSESIVVGAGRRVANFAASSEGTMVYVSGGPGSLAVSDVIRLDRTGRPTPLPIEAAVYNDPRLSPDARRVALTRTDGMAIRLFVFDVDRQVLSPLTPEAGRYFLPVWSPDGRRIAFTGFQAGEPRLHARSADGSDAITTLTEPKDVAEFPNSWSPDGQTLAYTVTYVQERSSAQKRQTSDIWLLPMDGKTPPHAWFEAPSNEFGATFSPDGRFLAYVSDESGRQEVYVRPYPGPGGKTQVSNRGGTEPAWSSNGREIVYREGDLFWSAAFQATPDARTSVTRQLFGGRFVGGAREDHPREYNPAGDGSFFVAIQPHRRGPAMIQLGVVTNWTGSLGK